MLTRVRTAHAQEWSANLQLAQPHPSAGGPEHLMAMCASQHYELKRREKENQNIEKSKRRSGNRPSDEGVVALEETKAASPQKLKTLDTHESPWRWERPELEEDLAVGGLPRKKENVRKKKR